MPFSCAASNASAICFANSQRFFERQRTLQGLALDQFHDQEVRADVVEVADIGVVQRSDGSGLALEALAEALDRDFDGDIPTQPDGVSAIHLAHPALANGRDDLIGAEPVSGCEG
jgi:hypothetical protein